MTKKEAQKLLGGYATGTLTPDETRALFEAALEDQELFNELNREQALRDVLDNGAARHEALAVVARTRALAQPPRRWRWYRWAVAAGAAAAAIVLGITIWIFARHGFQPENRRIAKVQRPALPVAPIPAPSVPAPLSPPRPRVHRSAPAAQPMMDSMRSFSASEQAPAARAGARISGEIAPETVVYTILRKDATGEFAAMPEPADLRAGDQIRISVRPAINGSLWLLENTGAETEVSALPEVAFAGNDYVLPTSGAVSVRRGIALALRFVPAEQRAAGQTEAKSKAAERGITIPIHLTVE